MITKLK